MRILLQKLTFANICCTIEQNATYLKRVLFSEANSCRLLQKAAPFVMAPECKPSFSPHPLTTPFFFDRYYSNPHPHASLFLGSTITFFSQLRLGLRFGFCFLSAPHIFLIAKFSACFLPLPHKHNVASYSSTVYVVCMLSL